MTEPITVVRDIAGLAALTEQWDDLAAHAAEPNPFYESWSLLPALETAGDKPSFRCVLAWSGSGASRRLAGLFPFRLGRGFHGLPVGVLTSWRHDSWLLCTPLIRAGEEASCLRALKRWIDAGAERAWAVEFRYVPADGPFSGHLADKMRAAPSQMLATQVFTRALLQKGPDAAAYVQAALSGDARKSLRRREKRLAALGKLERVALRPDDDGAPWIEAFLQLEAGGWKGKGGSALASTPANRKYASAMLAAAHARGRLQMVGLDLDGRPVSRCCNLLAGRGSYAYRTAYDEAFSQYSPGVMGEIESIAALHACTATDWMDSVTEPGNSALNRLWMQRRTIQTVLVGAGAWGELCVALLPLARWTKRRLTRRGASLLEPDRGDDAAPLPLLGGKEGGVVLRRAR